MKRHWALNQAGAHIFCLLPKLRRVNLKMLGKNLLAIEIATIQFDSNSTS